MQPAIGLGWQDRIVVMILTLLAVGCGEKREPEIPVPEPDELIVLSGAYLTAPPEGGEVRIRFSSTLEWKIDLPNTTEHFNVSLDQRSGAPGEVELIVTALPNNKGKSRSTTIDIIAGRLKESMVIRQEAMDVEIPPEEEVRKFLVRLYNDTEGAGWRFREKWCSDLPLSQWGSSVKYENGRLSLILSELGLKGDIDLSGCKALVSLRCSKNQIGSIDVSGCPLLEKLECVNSGLKSVDMRGCHSLSELNLSYNELDNIDVASFRNLSRLDLRENRLSGMDLRDCVSLKTLNCALNEIGSLTISHRSALIDVFCYGNRLRKLDLSDSPQLGIVNCGDNEIEHLNVKGCPRLSWIYCYENRLTALDVSDQKEVLSNYYCYSNRLERLDMSGFRKLSEFHCSDNGLERLDITGCRSLRWLYCSHNRLRSLEFSGLDTEIFERLDCSYNGLEQADIASLPKLLRLWCQGNRIGGEIPEHFTRLLEFEYDSRYEYHADGTYTDRGYGWWYPEEPQSR